MITACHISMTNAEGQTIQAVDPSYPKDRILLTGTPKQGLPLVLAVIFPSAHRCDQGKQQTKSVTKQQPLRDCALAKTTIPKQRLQGKELRWHTVMRDSAG